MKTQLAGKVAFVSGGTKGIGGDCTRLFAERGASVAFTSRNAEEGRRLMEELRSAGMDVLYIQCDVLHEDQIADAVHRTVSHFGKLDILVNNAATHISKLMHEYDTDDFNHLINSNFRNYFLHSKYAFPYLKETRGNIVNIASSTGKVGQYAGSLYAATKAAIIAFTKSVALDYARIPIRANAILPAYVDTPLLQSGIRQQPDPAKTQASLDVRHALGRISTGREIAAVAAFLASDDASTVTGSIVDADGGATLEYSPAVIDFQS